MRRRAPAPPPRASSPASKAPARTASATSTPVPVGLPSSFAGIAELLSGAGERVPTDALTLTNLTSSASAGAAVDVSGIWALDAAMAAARCNTVLRALDGKGRLMLPLEVAAAARVPAERDGALITVFLPGASDGPRPNLAVAPLPLDARGRLTVTAGVRRAAGIPDGADVYAHIDPERQTVTLTAASRLSGALTEAFDALRSSSPAPAADRCSAVSDDAEPAAELLLVPGGPVDVTGIDRRLRSVG